jgi:hypothetical protein
MVGQERRRVVSGNRENEEGLRWRSRSAVMLTESVRREGRQAKAKVREREREREMEGNGMIDIRRIGG